MVPVLANISSMRHETHFLRRSAATKQSPRQSLYAGRCFFCIPAGFAQAAGGHVHPSDDPTRPMIEFSQPFPRRRQGAFVTNLYEIPGGMVQPD
jgi:hypothetical protein